MSKLYRYKESCLNCGKLLEVTVTADEIHSGYAYSPTVCPNCEEEFEVEIVSYVLLQGINN